MWKQLILNYARAVAEMSFLHYAGNRKVRGKVRGNRQSSGFRPGNMHGKVEAVGYVKA